MCTEAATTSLCPLHATLHPPAHPGQGLLCDVIDLEQCGGGDALEAAVVRRGVCAQLDRLRDAYDSLPDLLTHVRRMRWIML